MCVEEGLVSEVPNEALEGKVKAQVRYDVSIGIVCWAFAIIETCYRYWPKLSDENA